QCLSGPGVIGAGNTAGSIAGDRGRTSDLVLGKRRRPRSRPTIASSTGIFLPREPLTTSYDTGDTLQARAWKPISARACPLRQRQGGFRLAHRSSLACAGQQRRSHHACWACTEAAAAAFAMV